MGKVKKLRKGGEEEGTEDLTDLNEKSKKATKKKDKSKEQDNEGDESSEDVKGSSRIQKSFAALQLDDDSSAGEPHSDSEDNEPKQGKNSKKSKTKETVNDQTKSGGKKGKKNRRKQDSDDEIEKVLAELELEYSGKANVSKDTATVEENPPVNDEPSENNAIDKESTDRASVQKKKKKDKSKPASATPQAEDPPKPIASDVQKSEDQANAAGEDKDTKKKKKKGQKEKEKEEKKEEKELKEPKKGPGKKTIAAMQEALKKLKEQEEQAKRDEEERIKREEEIESARLEALRLEQEKKERKKQKEKERKERLKAEGKLLTAKQKADRARAQALIDSLKAQGVELPDVGVKKPRLGTRVKPTKQPKEQSKVPEEGKSESSQPTEELTPPADVEATEPANDEEKPSSDNDVKDAWDVSSDEESEKDTRPIELDLSEQGNANQNDGQESSSACSSSSEDESESDDEDKPSNEKTKERALERIKARREEAEKNKNPDDLRAAVVCVLGHVDTGKTKILDKLRRTNVQDGEAGGITQQIGATNVPIDAIKEQVKFVKMTAGTELKIPGLLIIDTPGHESFSNLRNRGSSLCDIAILVVDIMHGLEPQTIESINILKSKKTPFLVALNKIDRLYDWQTMNRKDISDVIKAQNPNTILEFERRTKEVITQFAEQGLNAALFYENPDIRSYVSLVPTSAITGEGMGNLLALIVEFCQTKLQKRLMFSDELQATVLEVKAIPGLGTTIDVILVNGSLREGDTMICAGTDGPIVTQIRSLLMPQPLRELRVKSAYVEYKEIKAAQGVKIAAKDLEKAIAGLNLYIAQKSDEVDIFKEEITKELRSALSGIKLQERGVYVQASTLGSLEALLEFLRGSKIPYSGIRIGPVVKKDVMKASIMLEHESQYATILAFDVKVERDAQELADNLGVKIFQADIIYHLFDKFMAYREELKQRKREEFKNIAVFPCKLKVLPQFVFNSRDPIVCGVIVEAGIVKEGTPICVPSRDFLDVGQITSVEINHKPVENARKGMEVCIKIEPIPGEAPKMFGRHFDETDMLVSKISRQSIDACKDYFRDDLLKTDWQLMVELKKIFQIL